MEFFISKNVLINVLFLWVAEGYYGCPFSVNFHPILFCPSAWNLHFISQLPHQQVNSYIYYDRYIFWYSMFRFHSGVSSQQLMVLMGQVLSRNLASSSESKPGKMLNVIWPYLSRKEDAESYLQCIEAWMPYLLRHWRVSVHEISQEKMLWKWHQLNCLRSKRFMSSLTTLSIISGQRLKLTTSLSCII